MRRPRLLYVPAAAAFEMESLAERLDWADVESFDAPGVGSNRSLRPKGPEGIVDAGVARLDDLGWDSCAIVCDSHAQFAGIELALRERSRVHAIFIAHAAARYSITGARPALSPEVGAVALQLLETDYRTFARGVTQMTKGQMDDEYVERWIETVPQPVAQDLITTLTRREPPLVLRLQGETIQVVLARHKGCVLWTKEGFDDAAAALPEARVVVCDEIPERDPRFLDAIREVSFAGASG